MIWLYFYRKKTNLNNHRNDLFGNVFYQSCFSDSVGRLILGKTELTFGVGASESGKVSLNIIYRLIVCQHYYALTPRIRDSRDSINKFPSFSKSLKA